MSYHTKRTTMLHLCCATQTMDKELVFALRRGDNELPARAWQLAAHAVDMDMGRT